MTGLFNTFARLNNCDGPSARGNCDTNLPEVTANASTVTTVLSIVFGILGVVSVFMVIYSGLLFITGGDDPQKVKTARNTIIWALIGLAIALLAEIIIYTVLRKL